MFRLLRQRNNFPNVRSLILDCQIPPNALPGPYAVRRQVAKSASECGTSLRQVYGRLEKESSARGDFPAGLSTETRICEVSTACVAPSDIACFTQWYECKRAVRFRTVTAFLDCRLDLV